MNATGSTTADAHSAHVLLVVNLQRTLDTDLLRLIASLRRQGKVGKTPPVAKGWPGRCQPWLAVVLGDGAALKRKQALVGNLLKNLGLGSTRSACRVRRAACVSYLGDGQDGAAHLTKLVAGLQAPGDAFESADWVAAAGALASALRLSDSDGLLGLAGAVPPPGKSATPSLAGPALKAGAPGVLAVSSQGLAAAKGAAPRTPPRGGGAESSAQQDLAEAFARAMCDKGMPHALEVYARGLPPLYPSAVHQAHVEQAVAELRRFTGFKGQIARRAERRLSEQCRRVWHGSSVLVKAATPAPRDMARPGESSSHAGMSVSGARGPDRRQCEEVSLRGRPCVKPMRDCVPSTSPGSRPVADRSKCSSGVTEKVACACGRSILVREDPFEPHVANVTGAVADCCTQSRHCVLAVSPAPPPESRGAWAVYRLGDSAAYDPAEGLPFEHFAQGFNRLEEWPNTPVQVGLEYELVARGTRQVFAVASVASLDPGGARDAPTLSPASVCEWPGFDVDLFLAPEPGVPVVSQLRRVFIRVGKLEPLKRLQIRAEVHFDTPVDGPAQEPCVLTHAPIDLPEDGLFCLSLPHVFQDNRGNVLEQALPDARRRFRSCARLKAGLVALVTAYQ